MTLFISSEACDAAEFTQAYQLAGLEIVSQRPIALIDDFKVDAELTNAQPDFEPNRLRMNNVLVDDANLIYQGEGSFSAGMQEVAVWQTDHLQLLQIANRAFSLTDLRERHIRLLGKADVDQHDSAEKLLGPPLLTSLASRSIFSLHAGAALTEQGAVALIGESGRGKSTLSQSAPHLGWQRLGDDIMPVTIKQGCVSLLPRFPQLKCHHQHIDCAPHPLSAIFYLSAPPDGRQQANIKVEPVVGMEAVLLLARHTAASRVFDKALLASNMAFNQSVIQRVPIYRLSYPRNREILDEVKTTIIKQLMK